MKRLVVLCCVLGVCLSLPSYTSHEGHFTDDFVVKILGGPQVAERVARSTGFRLEKKLAAVDDFYHFSHSSVARRSKRSAVDFVNQLCNDPNVVSVSQQRILHREKREILYDKQLELPIYRVKDPSLYQRFKPSDFPEDENRINAKDEIPGENDITFIDPNFRDQWYLRNTRQTGGPAGYDINVVPVWKKGITGKGVVVSVLDDGLDHTHPDLKDNYDKQASADFNDKRDNDPSPDMKHGDNSHGTRCAGEIAAAANNTVCGVGVAFNAKIGGVRMLDGPVTDQLEGEAVSFNRDYIDIYSASWGPRDDGKTMEAPGEYFLKAMEETIKKGRDGKGAIYAWATGNGGAYDDDCNCDGYVSSIYSISIGSINDEGKSSYFSEWCPSTLAVIFTGGSHAKPGDESFKSPKINVVTTDVNGDCTLDFQGTSSAAPMAAGCFALVLEANPNLTWRDMQHLIVQTARVPNPDEPGWTMNGADHHVNHRFGFGALDCGNMVDKAQGWINKPDQKICEVKADNPEKEIKGGEKLKQTLKTDGCEGKDNQIDHLEHVRIYVELKHRRRGDISLTLTSPHGTKSEILSERSRDNSADGIDFTFMTVHNWNEDPKGTWTLTVKDKSDDGPREVGTLEEWNLTFYGYQGTDNNEKEKLPESVEESKENAGKLHSHKADKTELKSIMKEEKEEADHVEIDELDDVKVDVLLRELNKDEIFKKAFLKTYSEMKEREEKRNEVMKKYVKKTQEPVHESRYNDPYSYDKNDRIQHEKEFTRKQDSEAESSETQIVEIIQNIKRVLKDMNKL